MLFLLTISHFVWVYPLRHKSDVFAKFVHFRQYVKNQFKTEIQSFQCDNGGEYNNNQFHQLCNENGINIRFACPYTSQQNGKSERMLRTLNKMTRITFSCPLTSNLLGRSSSHDDSSSKYYSLLHSSI